MEKMDSKMSEETFEKISLLKKNEISLLYAADTAGNVQILFNGSFPITCFNLRNIINTNSSWMNQALRMKQIKSTPNNIEKIGSKLLCSASLVSGDQHTCSFLSFVDTRVLDSRILKNESYREALSYLQLIEEHLKFLDLKLDTAKNYWKTFYKTY